MRMVYLAAAFAAAAAGVAGLSGCGDLPRSRVHGKITHQGKAVANATVIFLTKDHMTYSADLAADGTYQVAGVPRGPVRVSVQQALPRVAARPDPDVRAKGKAGVADEKAAATADPPPSPTPSGPGLPAMYTDPAKSGLAFELKDPDQEWSVDLK